MKISNGFVTNSSSTSFVISSKNKVTKKTFIKAMGVEKQSLVFDMFEELFNKVENVKEEIPLGVKNLEKFFDENGIRIHDSGDVDEIRKRYNAGEKVYYGRLSDGGDGDCVAFFSHESFVIIEDDFYFNARNSAY